MHNNRHANVDREKAYEVSNLHKELDATRNAEHTN